jgi:putative phosphoribosyl transferase
LATHQTKNEVDSTSVEVRIPCGTVTLEGALVIPPGARGIVVFAHGSGSSRRSPRNQFVARIVRESGNGTLLFDLLSAEEEIEDHVTRRPRFAIGPLAGRLAEVTRWLEEQQAVRNLGIGYFGSSTGAGAALLASAEVGQRIEPVVSRGGRPDLAGEYNGHICFIDQAVGKTDLLLRDEIAPVRSPMDRHDDDVIRPF